MNNTNEITDKDIQEHVEDFWHTFDAEEKAALKSEGIEPRKSTVIFVNFKTKEITNVLQS